MSNTVYVPQKMTITLTISELLERYSLKTRQTLYKRLNTLGITLEKDPSGKGFASSKQIELLDQLHKHIEEGGTNKNFVAITKPTIEPEILDDHNRNENLIRETNLTSLESTQVQLDLFDLVGAISTIAKSKTSPLQNLDELYKAAQRKYLLTTKQVYELVGAKPHGSEWIRGSFKFIKKGKIGSTTAWLVEQVYF